MLHDIDTFICRGSTTTLELHSSSTSALDPQRHLRPQRAQGPVRGRGRRRRGAPLAVPRRARAAARRQARATASSTTCARTSTNAAARPRSTATSRTSTHPDEARRPGSVVLDPGSFTPTPSAGQGGRPSAGPRSRPQAINELMIDAQALGDRASAAGRRAADRLLLPRPHLRDRHARPGPRLARRDLGAVPRLHADRARRGLRHHADLGRRATSSTSTPRRSAAAATRSTCTRASAGSMRHVQRRHARTATRSGFRTTVHGPVIGYATVNGRKVAISSQALELRQGRRSTCCSTGGCPTARCTARSRSSRPPR